MEDTVTQFQLCVYTVVADIPEGRVSTYTAIARILECSPRAVRLALRRNPFALEIPCHRVIASNMVILHTLSAKLAGEKLTQRPARGRVSWG